MCKACFYTDCYFLNIKTQAGKRCMRANLRGSN